MIISCASGKGGTGKTTIATSLALSLETTVQFLDCDVEEPNAHIFLRPLITISKSVSIPVPEIDSSKCDFCGECARICVYNAIAVLTDSVLTFAQLCHGCGGCSLLCPRKAIAETEKEIGVVESGKAGTIDFVHGKLTIGESLSPPLIRAVKKCMTTNGTVIVDAPPGTSCPVIASVKDSDFCILVTEPTPFGLHDLVLANEVVRKLSIPFGVIINRADVGDKQVGEYCEKENIPVLMSIPFDREIAVAYSKGIPLVERKKEYKTIFKRMYEEIKRRIDGN